MHEEFSVPATIGKGKFEAAVVAARILTLAEIVQIPGFAALTPEQQSRVAHTPANLQWLSRPVYWMQRGRSAAALRGVDPGWRDDQVRLAEELRADLYHRVAAAASGDSRSLDDLEFGGVSMISGPAELQALRDDGSIRLGADSGADGAAERVRQAVSRWNADFLDLVPGFAHALHTRLRDVRPCEWDGEGPALLYFFEDGDGGTAIWVGWEPRGAHGPRPPFWATLPTAVRRFLDEVHPGFTMLDGESHGLAQPSYMSTFAAWAGWPDGIPDWDREVPIASTALLWLTGNGGDTALCASPELAAGQAAVLFEGDLDIRELGPELDALLLHPLRL